MTAYPIESTILLPMVFVRHFHQLELNSHPVIY